MLPYLGQGAAMAVEDGCILARVLENGGTDYPAMLQRYEALRKPRGARSQLVSRERAKENHLTSPAARLWRDAKLAVRSRFGSDKTTLRARWVYDYDPASASIA